jgi:hypothetical protein
MAMTSADPGRVGGLARRERGARTRADATPHCAVKEKLAAPEACLTVVRDDGRIVGMALAEPYRDGDGSGAIVDGGGHVPMVFVDPARWGAESAGA